MKKCEIIVADAFLCKRLRELGCLKQNHLDPAWIENIDQRVDHAEILDWTEEDFTNLSKQEKPFPEQYFKVGLTLSSELLHHYKEGKFRSNMFTNNMFLFQDLLDRVMCFGPLPVEEGNIHVVIRSNLSIEHSNYDVVRNMLFINEHRAGRTFGQLEIPPDLTKKVVQDYLNSGHDPKKGLSDKTIGLIHIELSTQELEKIWI